MVQDMLNALGVESWIIGPDMHDAVLVERAMSTVKELAIVVLQNSNIQVTSRYSFLFVNTTGFIIFKKNSLITSSPFHEPPHKLRHMDRAPWA